MVCLIYSIFIGSAISLVVEAQWQDSFRLDFDYEPTSEVGPDNWNQVDVSNSEWRQFTLLNTFQNQCGIEARPSPISVSPNAPCFDDREMGTRQIESNDCTRDDLAFDITPQGLRAYMPPNDASCRRPRIVFDSSSLFRLVWMDLKVRAEHVVDGRRYDGELQMVHAGGQDVREEVLIVSVLIEANGREDNEEFQYLLDGWEQVSNDEGLGCFEGRSLKGKSSSAAAAAEPVEMLEFDSEEMDGNNMHEEEWDTINHNRKDQEVCVPDKFGAGCEPFEPRRKPYPYTLWPGIWYYSYEGSLTTPPCSSFVNWRVLDVPMQISRRQFKKMAELTKNSRSSTCAEDTSVSSKGENFRPLQELRQGQIVSHCTIDDFSHSVYPPSQQ